MAAGSFSWAGTQNLFASDSSCASIRSSVDAHWAVAGVQVRTLGCAVDPVIEGTQVSYIYGTTLYSAPIVNLVATPPPDASSLVILTLVIVALFFAGLVGYQHGYAP